MFIKSLFLGTEGNYKIFDMQINFKKDSLPVHVFGSSSNTIINTLSYTAEALLNNRLFCLLTTGYLHTFIHEMGHALSHRILLGTSAPIQIQTDACRGSTHISRSYQQLSPIAQSIIDLAGPLADVIFSICKIVTVRILRNYIPRSLGLTIKAGAFIWIVGELFYAAHAAGNKNWGDFGKIAQRGPIHLMIATTILVGTCSLGILFA